MTRARQDLRRPAEIPAHWRTAGELLRAGQYEQVAELLREAQATSERTGDALLAGILDAAHRICLACRQFRDEAAWHRRAGESADQREHEFRQQLFTILDLISGHGPPQAREPLPAIPAAGLKPPERSIPESSVRLSLWQRLRGLLERQHPPPPEQESPASSAEASTPFSSSRTHSPTVPPVKNGERKEQAPPSLVVYCLGAFRVYQDDKLITHWPSGKGKSILKYVVANRSRPIPKEILMDRFWRDVDPDAARNNLNVAIYGLRQALRAVRPDFSHILFENDCYFLNPAMGVWVDIDEFMRCFEAGNSLERKGKLTEAMREYEAAEGLYQGDFLEEDVYEDWSMLQREALRGSYLLVLDRLSRYHLDEERYATCIHLCRKMLTKDDCREDVHRRLMRCYTRQGQRNLALRQYHLCVERLRDELDALPTSETRALYEWIRQGKRA